MAFPSVDCIPPVNAHLLSFPGRSRLFIAHLQRVAGATCGGRRYFTPIGHFHQSIQRRIELIRAKGQPTMAPLMPMDACDWCGDAPWCYRCAMCDPRTVKQVCLACSKRWHSRGFSREHELEDRDGTRRFFRDWMEQPAKSEHSATDNTMESKKEEITDAMVGGEARDASVEKQTHVKKQVKDQVQRDDQVMSEEQAVEFEHEAQVDDDQVMDDPNEGGQHLDFANMTLEELLQRFPTDDTIVHDALADHIHEAIGIEDAVLCRQYHKCQEPPCLEVVKHRKHAESQQCCGDPICQVISRFIDHRRECERTACPFCVRIKQRNLLGKRFCLDQIARQQRRALPTANPPKETFLRAQIAACERKKYATTDSVEELNALVLEHKLPVFNFPRFSWHVGDVPIKREPSLSDPPRGTTSLEPQPAEPPSIEEATDRERAPHVVAEVPSVADPSQYISDLIERKSRDDSTARIQYDQATQLAFRIVDASFCSPAKASRCLLDCQTILLHLQHHVDLAVCQEELCRTVEFHFSHVSKCVNAGQELECEYCLQVSEREYARAVEVMEHDQVEIESKLQSIIQSLTTSLSNDRGAEREHTVMQLEDELQQAEDHKRELLTKLSSSSLKLRKVRRRLRHHPSSPPSCLLSGLPLHFVKHSHHHRNDTKH